MADIPLVDAAYQQFVPLFATFMLFTFRRVFVFGGLVQAALLVWMFLCALLFPFDVEAEG